MNVVIKKNANENTVTVDGNTFDMAPMSEKMRNQFRRELIQGLVRLGKVRKQ